ncbi:ferritin-like domain-containing protein [Campylobacter hominis]|uniref:Ferritin-like domain-containing protein n=1 Tax=Campylobacter hominis (strain ATCC BAA-381 / DSM 21671 / CCUG 45161 / LMG 19568 / NCTC 13146 / CH001A) TaxID=360107 RepID=A7I1T7_CAMHC|nr:ferritin-like domain-containing protein [Campylobacter hominis]ABS51243.1 conserved hypothetical protein [Campylobacter hominis ATCC BAA-381]UAK86236.1 ferritin-like domain-containing protein [Campylobacter hominis]SUW85011.1 COG2833: uncharacterized protein [Campylobacter hominis]
MEFFKNLEEILFCENPYEKIDKFTKFYAKFCENLTEFEKKFKVRKLEIPSYSKIAEICEVKDIKKQNKGGKKAKFLHSIAHIEYSAIDLALDAAYRFQNLPLEFYADWLEVANDEIRHFSLINSKLEKEGVKYGDLAVHDSLFHAMKITQNSLMERMALVPRFLEANGLDANCFLINKLKPDNELYELKSLLQIILNEEISHVKKGDKWFSYECERLGQGDKKDEIYLEIVLKFYPKAFKKNRILDEKDRLKAGFTKAEIENFKNMQKLS